MPEPTSRTQARSSTVVPFDLTETKLTPPQIRRGSVARKALVDWLITSDVVPVVGVFAPAGYGKTTLLVQWAAADQRAIAWVSIDEGDNDPVVLLAHVAGALQRTSPTRQSFSAVFASPEAEVTTLAQRLCGAFAAMSRRVLLALDDVHLLHDQNSLDAVAVLALNVPVGSRLALAGRSAAGLPLARLRAAGRVLEVGVHELALDEADTLSLLKGTGIDTSGLNVADISQRTEGWAAGVYLAALSVRAENATAQPIGEFRGDDRFVVDYVRAELLDSLPAEDLEFLMRTSVLDRLCGRACDAILGGSGSAGTLARLEMSNHFVVALDRHREWYRYHHLFADVLRSELALRHPGAERELRGRAADWFEANGDPAAAVDHALGVGEMERAGNLVARLALGFVRTGRAATVRRWLDAMDTQLIERLPSLALVAGWLGALVGDQTEALRFLTAAERGSGDEPSLVGAASHRSAVALLRAAVCPAGVVQMRADAELAAKLEPPWSPWRGMALIFLGFAHLLTDDAVGADEILADTIEAAKRGGNPVVLMLAMAQRAVFALERGDVAGADMLSGEARELARVSWDSGPVTGFVFACAARVAQRRGDPVRLREDVAQAQRLRPRLTAAMPWVSALALLELARLHVANRDTAGVWAILREVDHLQRRCADLGIVAKAADKLQVQARSLPPAVDGASALTAAELRVLPYLPTHLSFREMGARLFVSPNTVKTQAISVYRKLDASSRSEAIARARLLGLLEEASYGHREDFIRSG